MIGATWEEERHFPDRSPAFSFLSTEKNNKPYPARNFWDMMRDYLQAETREARDEYSFRVEREPKEEPKET